MPEFIRLRSRAFAVTVAHQNQRRRFGVLDESNRRAFGVNSGVIVNRGAKERDHPLINLILAIVALQVGQTGAGSGGGKAIALRDSPHGHVTAVAPAGQPQAMLIDRSLLQRRIHASKNVAPVAIAEIFHIGAGEVFTLTEAAARIREENEVAVSGKSHRKIT